MANSTASEPIELKWVCCKGSDHGLTGSHESAVAFARQDQQSFMTNWYKEDRVQFDIMCESTAKDVKQTDIVYWNRGPDMTPFVLDTRTNGNGNINILYDSTEGKYYPLVDRSWLFGTSATYVTEYDLVVKANNTGRSVTTIRKKDSHSLLTWHTQSSVKGFELDDNARQ